jgi:putative sigma-54 modulation protein
MRIDVVGRNLEITPAIRRHAETKGETLTKYFDGLQLLTFRLGKDGHATHGKFDVELVCDVEKHDDFVCHAVEEDLYIAIDHAVQKASRQLTDFKERLKSGKR